MGQEMFKLIIIDLVALVLSVINGDLIVSLVFTADFSTAFKADS